MLLFSVTIDRPVTGRAPGRGGFNPLAANDLRKIVMVGRSLAGALLQGLAASPMMAAG
jgi:hypothetical protein